MPTIHINLYGVYKDGKEVFRGTIYPTCKFLGRCDNTVYRYVKSGELIDGYRIKMIGKTDKTYTGMGKKTVERPKPPKPIDMSKDHYEYLRWHLTVYGSTSCYQFDPVPYLPQLYEAGIDCRVKEIVEYPENSRVTKRGRRKKPKVHYFVEAVNANRGSQSV